MTAVNAQRINIRVIGFYNETMDAFLGSSVSALIAGTERLSEERCGPELGDVMRGWVADFVLRYVSTKTASTKKFLVVAECQGNKKIVGLAGCTVRPKTIHVDFLCSGAQGKRIGTRLLHRIRVIAGHMRKDGVDLVSYPSAAPFYEKMKMKRGPLSARGQTPEAKKARALARRRYKIIKDFNFNLNAAMSAPPSEILASLKKTARQLKLSDNYVQQKYPKPMNFVQNLMTFKHGNTGHFRGAYYMTNGNERATFPKFSIKALHRKNQPKPKRKLSALGAEILAWQANSGARVMAEQIARRKASGKPQAHS